MAADLNADLIWSLRALAQDAQNQRALYPKFVVVADELVLDFDDAYSRFRESNPAHPDLDRLDAHIATKSGILEYWTDEALDESEFWVEIRRQAQDALKVRGLTAFPPHPNPNTYVTKGEVWKSGRMEQIQPIGALKSTYLRILRLLRR